MSKVLFCLKELSRKSLNDTTITMFQKKPHKLIIFWTIGDGVNDNYRVWSKFENDDYDMEGNLTFEEVETTFNIENISLKCIEQDTPVEPTEAKEVTEQTSRNTNTPTNAFSVLMNCSRKENVDSPPIN